MPNLGEVFPNFEADTTVGPMKFHDFVGDGWAMLCSHPRDFTPVCTTELGTLSKMVPEFTKRNCKVAVVSCDGVDDHVKWSVDVCKSAGIEGESVGYPIIADPERKLAVLLNMLDPDESAAAGMPLTCRAVFIVGPDKKLKLSILYPASTGRNFDELIRVLDSLQLTATKKVATPANWAAGGECMVLPSVKAEELEATFPKGVRVEEVPSGKTYLRFTPQPE